MKLFTAIGKNLKLLFRSKESAYTIIAGPLLIILLVSFAFMGSDDEYKIRVATYAPAHTNFSIATIAALNEKYVVSVYPNEDGCVQSVKKGSTHACMVFSEREAGNGTIPVTFYLDLSRTNIIYQIADDLEGTLDLQTNAIRNALTGDALTRMNSASVLVDRSLNKTEALSDRFAQVNADLSAARSALADVSNGSVNVSLQGLRGYQLGLGANTRAVTKQSKDAIEEALDLIAALGNACSECGEELKDRIQKTEELLESTDTKITIISEDSTKDLLFEAGLMLDYALEDLAILNESLSKDDAARRIISARVGEASSDSEINEREIKQVSANLKYAKELLEGQQADAEEITTPVTSSVISVTASDDRLSFTYPYLLVLVIMFIGMLLASTLIVADKSSRAKFRNFTTPTASSYHIIVAFITAFIILALQVAVILAVSSIFIAQPLLLNPSTTLVIILITLVLFTFLGMIIGYLSSTQEAAMIASISVGSVLLFVSNLIVPVEGMAVITQFLTRFNPYLVLSELLKRSMLYGVSMDQVSRELVALGLLAILLLAVTVYIQRRIKAKYFRQEGGLLAPHVPSPLTINDHQVSNEIELLDVLDHMTRGEFERLVPNEENVISVWVATELRNKSLSRKLKTKSKERMMLALDKHLKKHAKRIKR